MLLYNIESMAKKMDIESNEVSAHIEHQLTKGEHREKIIRKYIKQLLPQKFSVGNGIIVDANGTQSKQQDFFIYDAFNSPVFLDMENSCVIPVESVFATVEIKSELTKKTLRDAIENIASVKDLTFSPLINSAIIPGTYNFIFGSIFAYTSDSSLDTMIKNLDELCKEIPKEKYPSLVCVFDKGLIVNLSKKGMNQINTIPSENTTWSFIKNTKELNLYLFYLILQQHLNTTVNFPPDLQVYANATHVFDQMSRSIPIDMISDDMFMMMGEEKYSENDMRFLAKNHPLFYKMLSGQLTEKDVKDSGMSLEELNEMVKQYFQLITRFFHNPASTDSPPAAGNPVK